MRYTEAWEHENFAEEQARWERTDPQYARICDQVRQATEKGGEALRRADEAKAECAAQAGVRRLFAPHRLRHAHAVEMAHEGVPLVVIQRQLGYAKLGITSIYLQDIDSSEILSTVHGRPSPTISASPGLLLRK